MKILSYGDLDDDNHTRFESLFKDSGGLFNVNASGINGLPKEFLTIVLSDLQGLLHESWFTDIVPESKGTYVNYINSMVPNAFANKQDRPTIGLSVGLVLNYADFLMTLMSSRDFLSSVDSSKEVMLFGEILESLGEIAKSPKFNCEPVSKDRSFVAMYMLKIGMVFILGHEVTHLVKHADKRKGLSISEFLINNNKEDSKDIDDYKVDELEADTYGAILSYEMATHYYNDESIGLDKLFEGPAVPWLMSIKALLLLLEKLEDKNPSLESMYPISWIRQQYSIMVAMNYAKNKDFYAELDFKNALRSEVDSFELIDGRVENGMKPFRGCKAEAEMNKLFVKLKRR